MLATSALLRSAPLLAPLNLLRPYYGSVPILLGLLCLLWVGLLRYALPGFGRRQTVAALGLCGLMVLSWLPRAAGRSWGGRWLTPTYYQYVILPMTAVQAGMLAGLLLAPLWVPLGRWSRRRLAASPIVPALALPPLPALPPLRSRLYSRRAVVAAAPWLLPSGVVLGAGYGAFIESQRVVVRRLRIAIPGLQPSLHGFRIGQVTDLHIARDLTQLRHLESALARLTDERLDILCATGDLCDEPKLFTAVLRMLGQVPTRLGHFGCLGNHELVSGLATVRRAYDRSPVQLLEDESVRLGGPRLAGIGYPTRGRTIRLSLPDVPLLLDEALSERKPDEPTTTVLLAHHPHVIGQLGDRNVALVLSGHTHGAQLGLGDGSALERLYPYARGLYRAPPLPAPADGAPAKPATQLFVSSGLGHWLPVRINCPPEVVILELVPA
jgi:predicted MPP superfamily phosphohydrolase